MNIYWTIIYIICGIYLLFNFKYDIQMLQQNSYRISRYWGWLRSDSRISNRLINVDTALVLLLFSVLLTPVISSFIIAVSCVVKIIIILKKKYKKPLVFTPRVRRIYAVTGVLAMVIYISVLIFYHSNESMIYPKPVVAIGLILISAIFSWIYAIAAIFILSPIEKMINKRYYNDARRILKSMPNLTVIGITGSYGKTSTKHYLNRILSESFDVLMTPGSYNTPMGVIRTVREMMKPYHTVFICEMGAKQKGDIKEICDLVDPQMGIITAVGPMHLETFKTIDCVQSTKFELADALPANGLIVINNDFEYCANREVKNCRALRYTTTHKANSDFEGVDITYTADGTSFNIKYDNKEISLSTKLVGECNVSNLIAAVIIALELGVSEDKIRHAVASIEQVEHRLNMKRTAGGVTIIDDAFNSNPTGSRMAIDVLGSMKNGQRIIVTPGMIELGDKQYDLNRDFGKKIGEGNVDVAIIVGTYNRDAIVEGIKSTNFSNDKLHVVADFNEAQKLLATILRKNDTVLYENDLPDTFK